MCLQSNVVKVVSEGFLEEVIQAGERNGVCQVLTLGATSTPPHLENDDKKEVEVGESVELLLHVQGQEREEVVLGCADNVALECEPAPCPLATICNN